MAKLTIALIALACAVPALASAQLLLTTPDATTEQILYLPDPASGAPMPVQTPIAGLPADAKPQGIAWSSPTRALVADATNYRVFVVDTASLAIVDTIPTPDYEGGGTIAISPDGNHALAIGTSSTLNVIAAPFTASSAIATVETNAYIDRAQTEVIAFDATGRAFVAAYNRIAVLDPPYTSVAFAIPVPIEVGANPSVGGIAITPDGAQLVISRDANVLIYTAPFSAVSQPETLPIPDLSDFGPPGAVDGIAMSPRGNVAIVAAAFYNPNVYAIAAPFSASSVVTKLTPPAGADYVLGFEDVAFDPGGSLAIVSGGDGSGRPDTPLIEAASSSAPTWINLQIAGGRGDGAARFAPRSDLIFANDFDGD